LEGKALQQVVFGDETIAPQPYVLANPSGPNQIELQGGRLHGFTAGSVFDIYGPEAHAFQPPEQPLTRVKLVQVEALKAGGQFPQGKEVPLSAKAVEREHNFEAQKTRVYYKNLAASPALQKIKAILDAHPNLPVQTVTEERGFQLQLQ